jgi:hypothetical protein
MPTQVAFGLGLGQRLARSWQDVPPRFGLSFSTSMRHRYATLGQRVEIAAEANFLYDRYARAVVGSAPGASPSGPEATFDDTRTISLYDFSLLQTASIAAGRMRAWTGVGAGLELGYFSSRERILRPGESRLVAPLARAAGGIDLAIRRHTDVGLRVDYVRPLDTSRFTTEAGETLEVFGSRLAMYVTLMYRI